MGLVDSMDVWHEQSRAIASALEESAAQSVTLIVWLVRPSACWPGAPRSGDDPIRFPV